MRLKILWPKKLSPYSMTGLDLTTHTIVLISVGRDDATRPCRQCKLKESLNNFFVTWSRGLRVVSSLPTEIGANGSWDWIPQG
jgi:hypothetical protein